MRDYGVIVFEHRNMIGKILTIFVITAFSLVIPCRTFAAFFQQPFGFNPSQFQPLEKHFIEANEWFDGIYREDIKNSTGALVTVGTFRAFQKIHYGNFGWAVIVDVDPVVAEFNELNYKAILQAKNLREYLRNFPTFYVFKYNVWPKGFSEGGENKSFKERYPLYQFMEEKLNDSVFFVSGKDDSQNAKFFKPFFFDSEVQFQLMKSKLASTHILSITGSFTEPLLATKIQEFLTSKNTAISVVDISNVMDYILPRDNARSKENPFVAGMIEFIEKLNLTEKAKLLFTSFFVEQIPVLKRRLGPIGFVQNDDGFTYYRSTSKGILEILADEGPSEKESVRLLDLKDFRFSTSRVNSCRLFYR